MVAVVSMAPASTAADVEALLPKSGGSSAGNPVLRRQGSTITKNDYDRVSDFLTGLKDQPEDGPIKQGIRCFFKYGVKPLLIILMAYVWIGKQLYKVYKRLPLNAIRIVFGAGLCFFGGAYFAAIAAVEAAINFGGDDLWLHLSTVWDEGSKIAVASAEDDKVDANQDQIPDVDQMSFNDLITHKAQVAMVAVTDPMRLQKALVALGNVYIAVIATLKFQFARTVAIALGIANMLAMPAAQIFGPPLCFLLGKDLNHWAHTTVDTTIKVIAVVFASYLQQFISGFYSGLRGGKMVAVGLVNILGECGCWDKLPDKCVDKPFDADKSWIDEVIGFPIAAVGFYWQVTHGFSLDFPWSILVLPLDIIEWVLRFQTFT